MIRLRLYICLGVCVVSMRASASDALPAAKRAAADAIDSLTRGAMATQWQDASLQSIQPLDDRKNWYVARVERRSSAVGYVVLIGSAEGTLEPAMYSGSSFPASLINALAPGSGSLGPSADGTMHVVAGVPMIATPKLRSEKLKVSSIACCSAGMLMWIQQQQRLPFLYLPEEAARLATRPFDVNTPCLKPAPSPKSGELTSYYTRVAEASDDPGLWLPSSVPSSSASVRGAARRAKDESVLAERLLPILREELKKDLSRQARWDLMQSEEFPLIAGLLSDGYSEQTGMVSAAIIESYCTWASSREQGLEEFLASRGFQCRWRYDSSAGLGPDSIPCVMCNSNGEGVLVTGISQGGKWLACVIPDTVVPEVRARRDMALERLAKAKKDDPSVNAVFRTPESIRQLEQAILDGKARWLQGSIVRDPRSGVAGDVRQGMHVARVELFGGWRMMSIEKTPK